MHHLLAIAHPQCTRSDGHPPHTPYRQNEARRILLFGFCTRCRRSGTPGGASDVVRVRPLSVVALAFIEIGRVRKSGAPSSFKFVYTSSNPIVLGSLWMFPGGDRQSKQADSQPNEHAERASSALVQFRLCRSGVLFFTPSPCFHRPK